MPREASTGLVRGKQIALRLLGVALVVAVVALCTHAVGHWHTSAYDELHCQACKAGHTANPQPPALGIIQPPVAIARYVLADACAPELEIARSLSIPRAPPV